MNNKFVIFFAILISGAICDETVLFAINLGGDAIRGSDGIQYKADLGGHRKYMFRKVDGVNYQDEMIYRTAFWDTRLDLSLPNAGDGNYTLIFKSEGDLDDKPIKVSLNDYGVLWNYKVTNSAGFYVGKDVTITLRLQNGKVHHNELDTEFDFDSKKSSWSLQVTGQANSRVLLSAVVWKHSPFPKTYTSSQLLAELQRDDQVPCKCEPTSDDVTRKELEDIKKLVFAREAEYKKALQALTDEFAIIKKVIVQQTIKKNETMDAMDCQAMVSDEFENYSRSLSKALERL